MSHNLTRSERVCVRYSGFLVLVLTVVEVCTSTVVMPGSKRRPPSSNTIRIRSCLNIQNTVIVVGRFLLVRTRGPGAGIRGTIWRAALQMDLPSSFIKRRHQPFKTYKTGTWLRPAHDGIFTRYGTAGLHCAHKESAGTRVEG